MDERLTLTVPEVATLLGIGRGTAYEAVRTGQLPSIRLGRRVLIARSAVEQMLGIPKNNDETAANGLVGKVGDDSARPES